MRRRLVILGSTGSIGENALRVVRHLGDRFEVVGLAAGSRTDRLCEQAAEFGAGWVYSPTAGFRDRGPVPPGCRILDSEAALCDRVAADNVDLVLCAIVGTAGVRAVLAAVGAGKDIALASKEVLVMAGEIVMRQAALAGARILPVDSEHCAVFQCLEGHPRSAVKRLLITASGGPFRRCTAAELAAVTPEAALAHPTWNMGTKITIDSATLMNKGLEIIEARWLFDLGPEQIEAVVHPQSIVHSMVEFRDGSILAQMGNPDMCLPIQYCLTYPDRVPSLLRPLDFSAGLQLDFEPPDHARFPAIRLAKEALLAGGTMPAVYNAANEAAVARFSAGEIPFPGIWQAVEAAMARHEAVPSSSLDVVLEADREAREWVRGMRAEVLT